MPPQITQTSSSPGPPPAPFCQEPDSPSSQGFSPLGASEVSV